MYAIKIFHWSVYTFVSKCQTYSRQTTLLTQSRTAKFSKTLGYISNSKLISLINNGLRTKKRCQSNEKLYTNKQNQLVVLNTKSLFINRRFTNKIIIIIKTFLCFSRRHIRMHILTQDNKYNRTHHPTCGFLITRRLLIRVDKIGPIVSYCVPCSTNRDVVHTQESVVNTVLLGLRIVR